MIFKAFKISYEFFIFLKTKGEGDSLKGHLLWDIWYTQQARHKPNTTYFPLKKSCTIELCKTFYVQTDWYSFPTLNIKQVVPCCMNN